VSRVIVVEMLKQQDVPPADTTHGDAVSPTVRRRVVVLLNRESGAARRLGESNLGAQIVARFVEHGIDAEIVASSGPALPDAVHSRVAVGWNDASPSAIVAAGGDGTIRAVAQELVGTAIPFGILPLGTLNHFARDLGVPLDLGRAVAAIAGGHTVVIDAAEVNGRIFVNNSSIGLYPEMVRDRDRQQRRSKRGKWLAMAIAFFHVLRHPRPRRLAIEISGSRQLRKTPFAFVGNNSYGLDLARLGRRGNLSGGALCLFIANTTGRLGLLKLLVRAAFGRLDQTRDFERMSVPSLVIYSRRRALTVSLDGEVERISSPLCYRSRPASLNILAPDSRAR
jgi:diacylglycerol kinase family enzyme